MTTENFCLAEVCQLKKECIYECVREELFSDELGSYVSYGLRCIQSDGEVQLVSDISPERCVVEALVKRCNNEGLEYIHLYDVIEDILSEMY